MSRSSQLGLEQLFFRAPVVIGTGASLPLTVDREHGLARLLMHGQQFGNSRRTDWASLITLSTLAHRMLLLDQFLIVSLAPIHLEVARCAHAAGDFAVAIEVLFKSFCFLT